MKNGSDKQKQTQVRMSDALKTRIRKYQASVRKETGLQIGFSTATRALLEQSLDRLGIR
jgi:hypothetical protein